MNAAPRHAVMFVLLLFFFGLEAEAQCVFPLTATPEHAETGEDVVLRWGATTGCGSGAFVGFRLWAEPPGGTFTAIADLLPAQRTYTYRLMVPGVYRFYVEAFYACVINPCTSVPNEKSAIVAVTAQLPCSYTMSDAAQFTARGGTGTVTVMTAAGCAWSALSQSPFITITSGASGSGPGSVVFAVGVNHGGTRTGAVMIAARTIAVSQAGPVPRRRVVRRR